MSRYARSNAVIAIASPRAQAIARWISASAPAVSDGRSSLLASFAANTRITSAGATTTPGHAAAASLHSAASVASSPSPSPSGPSRSRSGVVTAPMVPWRGPSDEGLSMTACLDDETVLGLVEGRLEAAALARVDDHLDACDSCRDLVSALSRSRTPATVLERGQSI